MSTVVRSTPEPSEPLALRVSGLRRSFGRLQALDGINLDLGMGEWTALLGPNGAGKTTLMRCIAGLLREDEGVVSAVLNAEDSSGGEDSFSSEEDGDHRPRPVIVNPFGGPGPNGNGF